MKIKDMKQLFEEVTVNYFGECFTQEVSETDFFYYKMNEDTERMAKVKARNIAYYLEDACFDGTRFIYELDKYFNDDEVGYEFLNELTDMFDIDLRRPMNYLEEVEFLNVRLYMMGLPFELHRHYENITVPAIDFMKEIFGADTMTIKTREYFTVERV